MDSFTYLINGPDAVSDIMETVDDDLGLGKGLLNGYPIGRPHINDHILDLMSLGESTEILEQKLQAATVENIEYNRFNRIN